MPAKITDRPEGWLRFRNHRDGARKRGIPFLFDFESWWAWWQVDGRWERRGRGAEGLVMGRIGDVGPYSPENVYCTTGVQNLLDTPIEVRRDANRRAAANRTHNHLKVRGVGHPRSKMVDTPAGRFGSAALAAEHYGIPRQTAAKWARQERHGWSVA